MNDPSHIALSAKPDALRSRKRIVGYDFARALAIFGMVIVNYKIVMGAEKAGPHWLLDVFGLLDGRAAATFVVLAGAGISLMTQRARLAHDAQGRGKCVGIAPGAPRFFIAKRLPSSMRSGREPSS